MPEVTTYYLEMNSATHDPLPDRIKHLSVREAEIKQYPLNRFLYQLVGEPWYWQDKLNWTDKQWEDYAVRDSLRTWVAYYRGSVIGYYELEQQQEGKVEIAYFGLVSQFTGKGFGRYLLEHCIHQAWALKETRYLWVHTCSLDHPAALANYTARGFKLFREEVEEC